MIFLLEILVFPLPDALITIAADDILKYFFFLIFFPYFTEEIRLDCLYDSREISSIIFPEKIVLKMNNVIC